MKAFRRYVTTSILLLALLSFYIPIRYQTSYPKEIGPHFDDHIRTIYTDLLNEEQPEVLLLGDSMLEAAVDHEVIAGRLDKKTLPLSLYGSASTLWYLILKNNILLAENKPEYLIIFFRDTMMTAPGYRATGTYLEKIDEFASSDDRLAAQRAYIDQMTPPEKIMERYVPLYGSRWKIRQSIDYYIRISLGRVLLDCDSTCMNRAMERVFKANNLDETFLSDAIVDVDKYMYTSGRLDFNDQVGKSLLPEIIRLCKENDIQLILVRTPILSFEEPGTQPSGLNAYVQNLAKYLDENEVLFFDFDQKDFTSEYFSDMVHLNEQGQAMFTQKLATALLTAVNK